MLSQTPGILVRLASSPRPFGSPESECFYPMATFDEFYAAMNPDSGIRDNEFEQKFLPWFLRTDPGRRWLSFHGTHQVVIRRGAAVHERSVL